MTWKKTDSNQQQIVEALRKCGFSVAVTSMIGKGFPDLVVGGVGKKGKCNLLVELKDGNKSPSRRKLTEDEQIFFDSWKGKIIIATTIDDILINF